jgi:hypothetical protein
VSRHDQRVAERFAEDVRRHRMSVVRDDGLSRHLRFRALGRRSYLLWFDLITWSGCLTINGDMGCYVFARVEDMFEFFRSRDGGINPSYWGQKLLATDRHSPPRRFDDKLARATFAGEVADWPPPARREAFRQLDEHLWGRNDDEDGFREAVNLVDVVHEDQTWNVPDFWECSLEVYSEHFLWCLHAIVWGIQQYDAAQQPAMAGGAS